MKETKCSEILTQGVGYIMYLGKYLTNAWDKDQIFYFYCIDSQLFQGAVC